MKNGTALPRVGPVVPPLLALSENPTAGEGTRDCKKSLPWNLGHDPVLDAGQRWLVSSMICLAHMTASAIAQIVAGTFGPALYRSSFRAARIAAMIPRGF